MLPRRSPTGRAALVAFWALTIAVRPADKEHTYGHAKSEYFMFHCEP